MLSGVDRDGFDEEDEKVRSMMLCEPIYTFLYLFLFL
jgi:hypothetical protein